DEVGWTVLAGGAMAGTAYGFFSSGPKVHFLFPLSQKNFDKLRLYCRYPQGLNNEQWQTVLRSYQQREFKRFP
ncbi:MAG: hypothetical protein ABH878_09165, partial [bacterium]